MKTRKMQNSQTFIFRQDSSSTSTRRYILTWELHTLFQVQYILGLENFRLIRGHLTSEKCLENVSWLCREWDWLRGIDYESQKAKLEELDKDTDEKSRVGESL